MKDPSDQLPGDVSTVAAARLEPLVDEAQDLRWTCASEHHGVLTAEFGASYALAPAGAAGS